MQRLVFAALILLAACTKSDGPVLGPAGLAPVQVGMTPDEAAKALGAALTPRGDSAQESCWYTHRTDTDAREIAYMVVDGKIARIDIGTPSIKTAEAIGVGTALAEVQAAYAGPRLQINPHKYSDAPQSYYVKVTDYDPSRGMVFEVVGGKVTTFRGGHIPEIELVEGCS